MLTADMNKCSVFVIFFTFGLSDVTVTRKRYMEAHIPAIITINKK